MTHLLPGPGSVLPLVRACLARVALVLAAVLPAAACQGLPPSTPEAGGLDTATDTSGSVPGDTASVTASDTASDTPSGIAPDAAPVAVDGAAADSDAPPSGAIDASCIGIAVQLALGSYVSPLDARPGVGFAVQSVAGTPAAVPVLRTWHADGTPWSEWKLTAGHSIGGLSLRPDGSVVAVGHLDPGKSGSGGGSGGDGPPDWSARILHCAPNKPCKNLPIPGPALLGLREWPTSTASGVVALGYGGKRYHLLHYVDAAQQVSATTLSAFASTSIGCAADGSGCSKKVLWRLYGATEWGTDFVVGGQHAVYTAGSPYRPDAFVARIGSGAKVAWTTDLGMFSGNGYGPVTWHVVVDGGAVYATGSDGRQGMANGQAWVARLSAAGKVAWRITLPGPYLLLPFPGFGFVQLRPVLTSGSVVLFTLAPPGPAGGYASAGPLTLGLSRAHGHLQYRIVEPSQMDTNSGWWSAARLSACCSVGLLGSRTAPSAVERIVTRRWHGQTGACEPAAPGPCNGSESMGCDDGDPCTGDRCGSKGCEHPPWPDGTSCGWNSVCMSGSCTAVQ